MKTFLEEFAEELLKINADLLSNTLVILPNRRAKLFLQKYISEKINKPIWLPSFCAINDFVFQELQMEEIKGIDLLIKLYQAHTKIEKKAPQSLDSFSNWGELLISDFNEIDLYMISAKSLFTYLSDAKNIQKWNLEPNALTQQEKNYLKFYESLEKYYTELKAILESENKAYQGMAYRLMAEKISDKKLNYSKIFIVGFNALSPAESTIIKHLETNYKATLYSDIDEYYYNKKKHEAGQFLRNQLKNKPSSEIKKITNYWNTSSKNINIYGVDGNIGQVKFCAELIENKIKDKTFLEENTAVILCNEDLMIPMINSIPENIEKFNLTMSYPLRLHSGYELTMRTINVFENYIGKKNENLTLNIYYKNFIGFINHQLIQKYLNQINKNNTKDILNKIHKENISIITIDNEGVTNIGDNTEELRPIFDILLTITSNPKSIFDVLIKLFDFLDQELETSFDKNFIKHFKDIFVKLQLSLSEIKTIEKLSTLKKWIQTAVNQSPIPFSGEPLEGLQIMGMLETRTLDFKNIILLSVNEGILPKQSAYQSFILLDIKRDFKMPLPIDNEAIMSYHFYRLLQRAENVNIIYNSNTGSLNTNEESRFIKQLELEIPNTNTNIKISHQKVSFKPQPDDSAEKISIVKTNFIMDKLQEYAENNGFSPSSLNNYKKCSYMFYLQKIVKLKKDQNVEEDMAYNTQGDLIHKTLEDFYNTFSNKKISYDDFENNKHKIKSIFENKLQTNYKNLNTTSGKNYLTKIILEQFLNDFISQESKLLKQHKEINIKGLEMKLEKNISIKINESNLKIKFIGNADRIDEIDETLRIVDYKTGAVKETDLKINISRGVDKWETMFTSKGDKAFQLMMYAWMLDKIISNKPMLQSGIIAFKKHGAFFPLSIYENGNITAEDIDRFETDLRNLVSEIFDANIDFKQCEDESICKLCDYKFICVKS